MMEYIDNAYVFIKQNDFERALTLLKKAYGLQDLVPQFAHHCQRDNYTLVVMFHNMGLCYQNLSMLAEAGASICEAIKIFPIMNLEE